MSKLKVEVLVEVEAEELGSYWSILVSWRRAIVGYVGCRSIRGSVFDRPESVVEVKVEDTPSP